MNRLLARAALGEMFAGRHLLIVSETQVLARHTFAELVHWAQQEQLRVSTRRANGCEQISGGGGSIAFRSRRMIEPGLRGCSFDIVILDCLVNDREWAALRACTRGSEIGEIIRA